MVPPYPPPPPPPPRPGPEDVAIYVPPPSAACRVHSHAAVLCPPRSMAEDDVASPTLMETSDQEWGAAANLDLFFNRVYR